MALSEEQIVVLEQQVREYLVEHGAITNRKLREIANIDYDDAIRFFRVMQDRGQLTRVGKASGTKYLPASAEDPGTVTGQAG